MNDALDSQIYVLEGLLEESQASAVREFQLRAEPEEALPYDWRRIHGELLNLREIMRLQIQDHEVLRTQALQLEEEVQHLMKLANDAQVIVYEQGDKVEA